MTKVRDHSRRTAAGPFAACRAAMSGAVLRLALLAFLAVCQTPPLQAQTGVDLDADASDGYARLVVTFPETLHAHEVRVSTGVIVVAFEEPVSVDVSRLERSVPAYVSAARRDPDGMAIRFALAQPVTVNTMEAGERLFIDLLPRDWVGRPPGLPQDVIDELARRAADAERRRAEEERQRLIANAEPIEMRVVDMPTFTRFVFLWDEPVDARLERSSEKVTVAFERFARFDAAGQLARLPEYIGGLNATNGTGGLEVEMTIDPAATVRGFRDDATYVVDVGLPPGAEGGADAAMPEPPADAAGAVRTLGEEESVATPDAESPGSGAPGPEVAVRSEPMPAPARAMPGEPRAPDVAPDFSGAAAGDGVVRAEARRHGSSVRLAFPFAADTPLAMFERTGSLWLVFDTEQPIDTTLLATDLDGFASEVEVDRTPGRHIVRLHLERPMVAATDAQASTWVVTLGDVMLDAASSIAMSRDQGASGGAEVTFALDGADSAHELVDPRSGERLVVVTAPPPARAVTKPRSFVEFSAPSTAHGIVVRPLADDVSVAVGEEEVVVSRAGGLTLSEVGDGHVAGGAGRRSELQRPGFVDLNSEAVLDPGVVHGLISGYIRAAAEARDEDRTAARLRLARALLATDLGAEALAQLNLIAREDVSVMRDPNIRAMRGIALAMMRRSDEALAELEAYGLQHSTDVALWRAVAEAQQGNWRAADTAYAAGSPALPSYSHGRQLMFGLAGARAAVELNDAGTARIRLEEIRDFAEPGAGEVTLLDGRIAELTGMTQAALQAYDAVADGGDRMLQAEARLRAVRLRADTDRIEPDAAIEELETLAATWRGDDIELSTLRFLAGQYVEREEFRRAFELMKSATIAAPDASITRALQDDMNLAFEALFLNDGAEEMDPVEALALYYDYRELTPIGRKGDEIIRRLADRLVEVDLLNQAAELLTHQVQHRLRGAARAQVAASLGMVHLMNRNPTEALAVLARTRQHVLPQSVQRQRMLIEARALAETGRLELALDMLSALDGDEVDALRADTLWRAERWQDAGELYEAFLTDRRHGAQGLDDDERGKVLRAAIAYALARDTLGLERLRARYIADMAESPDGRAFDIVTRPMPETAGQFRELVAELADTDTLDAFLAEYRARYGQQALVDAPQS